MKLDVVAQGVETHEQFAFVKARAKVSYQEYLLGNQNHRMFG